MSDFENQSTIKQSQDSSNLPAPAEEKENEESEEDGELEKNEMISFFLILPRLEKDNLQNLFLQTIYSTPFLEQEIRPPKA